jgi:hypothetical protein
MSKFALKDRSGNVLAIAEAADATDAEIYGIRSYNNAGVRAEPWTGGEQANNQDGDRLKESFKALGLSEAGAVIASRGLSSGCALWHEHDALGAHSDGVQTGGAGSRY